MEKRKLSVISQPLLIIAAALAENSFGCVTMLNAIAGHLIEPALTALPYFVFLLVIAASMLTAEGQSFSRIRFCLRRCSSSCRVSSPSTMFSLGTSAGGSSQTSDSTHHWTPLIELPALTIIAQVMRQREKG